MPALIVIDMQNGLENSTTKLFNKTLVIKKINQRIQWFRALGWPVIFIQHEDQQLVYGTNDWQIFSSIDALKSDYYIAKTHANSFYYTKLKELLIKLSINELEFCGAQTEYCIDTTIRMAHGLGFNCSMKKGTCTTLDSPLLSAEMIIQHHEAIWENRFLCLI